MITIKKTGEGYYLVTLPPNIKELGRTECHLIKKEIVMIIRPHREITLNIKGVQKIESIGYKILLELKKLADQKNCKLRFNNVDPSLTKKIIGLNYTKSVDQIE